MPVQTQPMTTGGTQTGITAVTGTGASAGGATGSNSVGGVVTAGTLTGTTVTGGTLTGTAVTGGEVTGSTASSTMGAGGMTTTATSATTTVGTTGATAGAGGSISSSTTTTSTTGSTIPDTGDRSPAGVCARWNADTANMSEGTWSGSIQGCNAGDISAEGRDNALRLFNMYRWLADLPAVVTDPERNQQAQECALMMDANNSLSHEPPSSWTCYTEVGAQGARTSNISSGPGVSTVQGYLIDTGNESTMGHRRIILSNWLGPIGLGSTGEGGSSCMQNIGGTGNAGKEWVAWPPPGAFPLQAYSNSWSSYSDTGWSIQSEDIDLSGAQITVTSAGNQLAMDVSTLTGNYGSTNGLRLAPNGWDVEAGETYSVSVTGIASPISYDLQIVDCN